MIPKGKKRFPSLLPPLSRRVLLFFVASLSILIILLVYKSHHVINNIANSNQSPSLASASPTPNPTSVTRPAEKCSVTSSSVTWDAYSCTHFTLQLPKGWYADYGSGQDTLNGRILSFSEFYNYDYMYAEGRSFNPVKDQGKQKFFIYLLLSNSDLLKFVADYEKLNNWSNFSNNLLTISNHNAIKVVPKDTSDIQKSPIYFIQNPSRTIVLEYGNTFGIDDTQLEEIFSTIKFTHEGDSYHEE